MGRVSFCQAEIQGMATPALTHYLVSHFLGGIAADTAFSQEDFAALLSSIECPQTPEVVATLFRHAGVQPDGKMTWGAFVEHCVAGTEDDEVVRYPGFAGENRRMLFEYGDHFPDRKPVLNTMLPCGTLENYKAPSSCVCMRSSQPALLSCISYSCTCPSSSCTCRVRLAVERLLLGSPFNGVQGT